jgi:hypothetical protein
LDTDGKGRKRKITKSENHPKIIGEFGESLIANLLSASRFEVARVDHVGLDLIAYSRSARLHIGITVKSRTRDQARKESDAVNLFGSEENHRRKLRRACRGFGCKPWIGVYVETSKGGEVYLTSLQNYDKKYRSRARRWQTWNMTEKYKQRYASDPNVKHIGMKFAVEHWDWKR